MKYTKHFTVKEWNRFCKTWTGDRVNGEELTAAEILLDRYKIILTDHINKKRIGGFVHTPLKEKLKSGLKSLPSKMTQKNFDKGMAAFDKGMADFNKSMDQFGDGIGGKKNNKSKMEKLWGDSKNKSKSKGIDMSIIWGKQKKEKVYTKKNKKATASVNDMIWGEPVQKKRKGKRKSQSDKWDKHEVNLTKIWGKKK